MNEFESQFFLATFFVTSLILAITAGAISRTLTEIRDDLREYFEAEGRRWASDYEWRNSE